MASYSADYKCGFAVIIGKPNVGKSTLMNRLVGEKLSIVSPRPQTTRHTVKGIYSNDKAQIVFLDTPGFLEPRYELHQQMINKITTSLNDADVIIYITDNNYPTDYDIKVSSIILKRVKIPKMALINKRDLFTSEDLLQTKEKLKENGFDIVTCISATQDHDFADLIEHIQRYLPYSPPFYDPENLSDLPMRFFAQEIIREQIFLQFKDEIPYSSTVTIESYHELPNKLEIMANVWLERKSQKIIFIGENGSKIKSVRQAAEKEIYKFTGKRVKLELWVKLKANWRKKRNALKEFGYV
ncbi:MAG: GTPase Era [Candidatus Cloacimonetes bacterium]|nr:GTPase Era [Candidatus Cloacimonadota bacterium]